MTRGPERTSQKQKTAQRTTRFPYLPGDPPPGPPKKAEALTANGPPAHWTAWPSEVRCLSFAHPVPAKPPRGPFRAHCPVTEQVALPAGLWTLTRGSCSGRVPRLGHLPRGAEGLTLCACRARFGSAGGEDGFEGHSQAMARFVAHVGSRQMLHSGRRCIYGLKKNKRSLGKAQGKNPVRREAFF